MDMYNYVERYVPNGEECDITVMFSNTSFTTIDNVTLACEINGEKTEETITFSPALAANSNNYDVDLVTRRVDPRICPQFGGTFYYFYFLVNGLQTY